MHEPGPLTGREIWVTAGKIIADHGEMTVDYIFDQLSNALNNDVAVEDWHRIVAAVDAISSFDRRC